MAHRVIPIPGESTRFDAGPSVQVTGAEDEPVHVTIKYVAKETRGGAPPSAFGVLTFHDVLEYRWVASFASYEDHAAHERDFKFGLIEILDSAYVENMASKGMWRKYPGERFGEVIRESEVKHYRLAFDEYGKFDIIAFRVTVQEAAA